MLQEEWQLLINKDQRRLKSGEIAANLDTRQYDFVLRTFAQSTVVKV